MVVVGVDPRWLLRSLQRQFRQVLSNRTTGGGGYWRSTPQDYLEKIFQIPFVLPPMAQPGFAALLRSLIQVPGPAGPTGATSGEPGFRPTQHAAEPNQATLKTESGSAAEQVAAGEAPERLDLTKEELDFLTHLAPLVRTPRTAKRMLNIYRMLRVTRDLGPVSQFLGDHDKAGDYQAVAQLLGVLTAFPTVFSRLCWGDNDADTRPLLARGPQERWSAFIENLEPHFNDRGWRSTAAGQLPASEVENCHRLVAALRAIRPRVTLPDQLAPYQLWAPRICCFSFSLSSHTTGAAGTVPADTVPVSIN